MFEAADDIVVKLLAVFFVGRLKLGHGGRVRFVELLSHERALAEQPLCVTVDLMKLRCVARSRIEFFPEVRDVVFSRLAKRCVCSKRLEKLAKRFGLDDSRAAPRVPMQPCLLYTSDAADE